MPSKKSKDHLVWMDLEMTGLDPEKEGIIEIATLVTDGDLQVIAEGPHLVIHQERALLEGMDAWNRKQHKKSGLLEEVKRSRMTAQKAERRTLTFLRKYCFAGKSPLCGNSVHHDRRFLIRWMPRLHAFLHYRHVDVSTLKALVRRWYPMGKPFPKPRESHRALTDILSSIGELRFYRNTYFVKEAG